MYDILITASPAELSAKYYALVIPSPPLPLVSIGQQQQDQPFEIDAVRGEISNGPLCMARLRHGGFTLAKLRLVKIFEYEV